jgi:hypothetical protein
VLRCGEETKTRCPCSHDPLCAATYSRCSCWAVSRAKSPMSTSAFSRLSDEILALVFDNVREDKVALLTPLLRVCARWQVRGVRSLMRVRLTHPRPSLILSCIGCSG